MKLYAPEYYKNFECIADRCSHSCCIGWEIDIDSDTAKKYAALAGGYGENIKSSIERADDGLPHFRLCENDRCPHLNDKGLCRIILEMGEGHLCDICREHPRFYNDTLHGREVGLGIACEEAARLVLTSDNYDEIAEIGEECDELGDNWIDFDAVAERKKLYAILSDKKRPFYDRLLQIYSDFGVSPQMISDESWHEIFSSLEYLDESHKALFESYSSALGGEVCPDEMLERVLAYFVFRHCTKAYDKNGFKASLGFSLVCERLLSSLARVQGASTLEALGPLAVAISEELEYSEENTDSIRLEFEII